MNRTHRIVVNRRTGVRQAVPETAKSSSGGRAGARTAVVMAIAAVLGAMPLGASAALYGWDTTLGSWFNPGNWQGGAMPTPADDAVIYAGEVQVGGGLAQIYYLTAGDGADSTVRVLAGGQLDAMKIGLGRGARGTVEVNGTGAWLNLASNLTMGFAGSGQGVLTIASGGRVTVGGVIELGATAGGSGTVNLNTGGTLELGGAGLSPPAAGGAGAFNWNGGTLRVINGGLAHNVDATLSTATSTIDTNGFDATLGGRLTGGGTLIKTGAGSMTLTGINDYTGATLIAQGTLALAGNGALAGAEIVSVSSGGIFDISKLSGAGTTTGGLLGPGDVLLGSKTLTVDTAFGMNFTGTIAGIGGSLVKQGGGEFVLNGSNNATGPTQVLRGRFIVGGSVGSTARIAGSVDVASGGTLGGFGSIGGNVTLASGAHLAAGNTFARIGALRIDGDLTIDSGAQLDFDFGAPGTGGAPGQSDNVSVGGDLTIHASTLNVNNTGGMGPGVYNLFSWGQALVVNGGFAPPPGHTVQFLLGTKKINLISSGGYTLNFWNGNGLASGAQSGGGDGTWSMGAGNWADANGAVGGPMQPSPGFAIFGGAAGNVTVDNSDGQVTASGLQFASDGYRLGGGALALVADAGHPAPVEVRVGDGSAASAGWNATIANVVAGTDGLAKTGAGTLTLTGANTYTGGTHVRAGTLSVASDAALGDAAGALVLDGGTLKVTATGFGTLARNTTLGAAGGTIEVDSAFHTLTVGSALGGSGGLTKTGRGTLALTTANGYTGGTSVAAGSLEALATGALGSGPVWVASKAALIFGGSAAADGLAITAAGRASPTDNAGFVQFRDNSSAGNAHLVMNTDATAEFRGTASAGTSVIENRGGLTRLWFNATAGKSQITNFAGGQINLLDDASAGQATFVNENGGLIDFFDRATADQATVVNHAGGRLRIRSLTTDGVAIGSVSGAGQVILGAKTLTTGGLGTDTEVSGVISGTGGSLVKTGSGTLTLSGANTYTGGTALKHGRLDLGHAQALGTGGLAMDDGTTLGFSADGLTIANAIELTGSNDPVIDTGAFDATLAGAISGGGFITKQGTGTLTLSGANTYTGATEVAQGTLRAGAVNTFSAASAHNVAAGATLDLAGFSQTVASLTNSGTVSLAGSTPGTTLTVAGHYVGHNGVLRLGSMLGEGGSADRLVIDGGSASGRTTVQITNLGGLGALTSGNGIEVVSARNGAITTAQTSKDAFTLAGGRVDAGAYEYRLHAADANGAGENWYLRSTTTTPAAPAAPVVTYRAEASLHAALPGQLRQGNLAMLGDLRRRVGDDDAKGSAAAPGGPQRRAWARVLSTDLDIQQGGTVSPTSKGRLTGVQAGTDLFTTPEWRAGLYVGQLEGDARVRGFASGLQHFAVGRNDLRSQYLGVYGTYSAGNGFYADAVLQSGRHRATTETMLGAGTTTKGHSLLGSLEIGQAFALGASGWTIEPQLQLIHQHMDLDDTAIVGAVVQPRSDSGWIARAGVRVKGEIATGIGTLQPYGRVNVYRTSSGMDLARFVNGATTTDIASPTGGTSTELAGGFTLALGQATSLYGEIGKLWASGGNARVKSSVNGSVGVRVRW